MSENKPCEQTLESGKYAWCSCGHSLNLPFCDGAHKGTEFSPVVFEVTEKKTVWLCGCRKTQNQPFCDGSHSS